MSSDLEMERKVYKEKGKDKVLKDAKGEFLEEHETDLALEKQLKKERNR